MPVIGWVDPVDYYIDELYSLREWCLRCDETEKSCDWCYINCDIGYRIAQLEEEYCRLTE